MKFTEFLTEAKQESNKVFLVKFSRDGIDAEFAEKWKEGVENVVNVEVYSRDTLKVTLSKGSAASLRSMRQVSGVQNFKTLTEAVTPELRAEYDKLVKEAEGIEKALKAKLKVTPVKFDSAYFTLKVGTSMSDGKNMPAFKVELENDYGTDKRELSISQSTNTFTKETLKDYSDMLAEVYKNHDLIAKSLSDMFDMKEKHRELNDKARAK